MAVPQNCFMVWEKCCFTLAKLCQMVIFSLPGVRFLSWQTAPCGRIRRASRLSHMLLFLCNDTGLQVWLKLSEQQNSNPYPAEMYLFSGRCHAYLWSFPGTANLQGLLWSCLFSSCSLYMSALPLQHKSIQTLGTSSFFAPHFEVHCLLQLLLRPQEISENKYLPVFLLLTVRNANIWEAKRVCFYKGRNRSAQFTPNENVSSKID